MSIRMNRRDFLLGHAGEGTAEISCESLFMRYVDSRVDGTGQRFLREVREHLGNARHVRLYDSAWLEQEGLKDEVQPLLEEFISRGGTIEYT